MNLQCICCEKTKEELGGMAFVRFPDTKYLLCYQCCELLASKQYLNLAQEQEQASSSKNTKKKIGNSLRFKVYERDGYKCRYCGAQKNLSLDHVIPEANNGENTEDNLVTACLDCNVKKRARTPDEAGMSLAAGD